MNWFVVTVTIIGGITTIAAFLRWVLPMLRLLGHFFDDWFGEPARAGQVARPGVMERLASVEHQVKNSHSTNLRDDIDALHATARKTDASLAEHVEQSAQLLAAGRESEADIRHSLADVAQAVKNLTQGERP